MSQQKHNKPPEAVLNMARQCVFGSSHQRQWDEGQLLAYRQKAIAAIRDYKAMKVEIENNQRVRAEISEWLKQNEHEA